MDESFDLSEVSNIVNNDSDGHLLAQFLKKKSKKVITRRIFGEVEKSRMSIEVCLRKADGEENENTVMLPRNEDQNDKTNAAAPDEIVPNENMNINNQNSANPLRITGRSPLGSYVRRTPHSNDKLRQYTLKRLAANQFSRRSLTNAFANVSESIVDEEFSPRIASTPLFANTPQQPAISHNDTKEPSKACVAPSSPRRYTVEKGESSGQILLTSLNSPLKNIENAPNLTRTIVRHDEHQSTLKPVEEHVPLTPTKVSNQSGLRVRLLQNSTCAPEIEITCNEHQVILSSKASVTVGTQNAFPEKSTTQETVKEGTYVQENNVDSQGDSYVAPSQPDNIISETELETHTIQSRKSASIKPINHNVDDIITDDEEPASTDKIHDNVVERTKKSTSKNASHSRKRQLRKRKSKSSVEAEANQINTTQKSLNASKSSHAIQSRKSASIKPINHNVDNIVTDDEEPVSTDKIQDNVVEQHPRKRQLGKRKSKSFVEAEANQINTTPKISNACKSTLSRRCLTLNKAPRTPINGEMYADELKKQIAGLSNLKVLDLRRRKSSLSKNKLSLSSAKASPFDARKSKHNKNTSKPSDMSTPRRRYKRFEKEDSGSSSSSPSSNRSSCSSPVPNASKSRRNKKTSKQPKKSIPPAQSGSDRFEEEALRDTTTSEAQIPNECENEGDNGTNSASPTSSVIDQLEKEGHENQNKDHGYDNEASEENELVNKTPPPTETEIVEADMEAFENESSSDRVSFVTKDKNNVSTLKNRKKRRATPELLKEYKNATERINKKKRKLNESKRSLYSVNETENNSVSPTLSANCIVSPPHMFRSSTPRKELRSSTSELFSLNTTNKNKSNSNAQEKEKENADDMLFKKPQGLPPKKKIKKTAKTSSPKETNVHESNDELTLRRSKRDRKPVPQPIFYVMVQENLLKSLKRSDMRKYKASQSFKNKSKANRTDNEMTPIASSTANSALKVKPKRTKRYFPKSQEKNALPEIPEDEQLSAVQANDFATAAVPEDQHDSIENNQLSAIQPNTSDKTIQKEKILRVKVQRLNNTRSAEQPRAEQAEISSTVSPDRQVENDVRRNEESRMREIPLSNSNWRKIFQNGPTDWHSDTNSQKSLTHLSLSTCDELTFATLNNMEYAFYTTNNFMGYIRFLPRQTKSPCHNKQNMNLLALSGEFNMTIDGETGYLKQGDLVTISKGLLYSIENLSNDISVLLFVKF